MKGIGKKANYGFQIVAVGLLTGLVAGLVVTLYNAAVKITEEFAHGYYGFFRENPAFIPLLFLALFAGSIVIGGVVRFLPVVRGSGVPQTEGATRGLFRFKWYEALTGMFAASLFTVFMGLTAGGEGPSIMIGGACGSATSDLLRRNATVRRYQVTGGACAGLAVAFNAPLTGMAFAFEEAHKRFTPEVFICSFSSVVTALIVRGLFAPLLSLPVQTFASFDFSGVQPVNLLFLAYALLAAIVCALCGVGFYYLVFAVKKLFRKITFWKGMGKMIIPFLIAGAFGLISTYAVGGGHAFIEALGDFQSVERVFSSPLWATLLIVVVLKIVATVTNMGAGVPCGVFIPMLAIGAGLGGLMSLLCMQMGMDAAYSGALIMICMATFFTSVVKAPVTGVVMVVELTWNFTYLLPVILGVAIGYLSGILFRTEPIYDKLLDEMLEEKSASARLARVRVKIRVLAESTAAGRTVRDVLWPAKVRITLVERGDTRFAPDGNTRLSAGDILYAEGETADGEETVNLLASAAGELMEASSLLIEK